MESTIPQSILEPHQRRLRNKKLFLEKIRELDSPPSQGSIKIALFLERLFVTHVIQDQVLSLRKELGVAPSGIELDKKALDSTLRNPFVYLPKTLSAKARKQANVGLIGIRKRVPVTSIRGIEIALNLFLFHDAYDIEFLSYLFPLSDLCRIENSKSLEQLARRDFEILDYYIQHIAHEDDYYPLKIQISKFAGQRDVIDFVKKNWHEINQQLLGDREFSSSYNFSETENLLSKGRVRNLEDKERNTLLYENRHLSMREKKALIKKVYPGVLLDDGEIGKIISLERKRRK